MKKRMLSGLICLAMLALLSGIAIAAEESIIVGTITEDNQIVAQDGQAYMIKQNKQADQEREEQQGEIPLLAVEARMQASKAEVRKILP